VLSVDWRADLAALRKTLGPKIALQGNVDPAVLLGPAEKIREATHSAMAALGGTGHILNLGHGIFKQTPVENARLFIETGQQPVVAAMRYATNNQSNKNNGDKPNPAASQSR
jgi:uroporphyrinogen decarboxylase